MGDEIAGEMPAGDGAGDGLREMATQAIPLIMERAAMLMRTFRPEIAAFQVYLEMIAAQQSDGVGPTDE